MKGKIIDCVKETPGITARDIGKLLGFTRKKINQHIQHYDCLIKDKDTFGWHYSGEYSLVEIELPSKWVNSITFEKILSCSDYKDVSDNNLTIVFLTGTKLMLDTIARLLSLVNQVAEIGRKVTIDLSLSPDSRSYLNRAGFYRVLHKDVIMIPIRPKTNLASQYEGNALTLVEFRKLNSTKRQDGVPRLLFESLTNFLDDEYEAIFTFIAEIYNNVYDHVFDLKATTLPAFAACQTYSRSNDVTYTQIVISDCGEGICSTLRPALYKNPALKKYINLSDIELIMKAFSVGRITRHDPITDSGHGIGLYIGAAKARDMNANITIRQQNFSIELKWEDDNLVLNQSSQELKSIPGTNICFDFSIE
jgi:hypothetical protein